MTHHTGNSEELNDGQKSVEPKESDVSRTLEATLLGLLSECGRFVVTIWGFLFHFDRFVTEALCRGIIKGKHRCYVRPLTFLAITSVAYPIGAAAMIRLGRPDIAQQSSFNIISAIVNFLENNFFPKITNAVLEGDYSSAFIVVFPIVLCVGVYSAATYGFSRLLVSQTGKVEYSRCLALTAYAIGVFGIMNLAFSVMALQAVSSEIHSSLLKNLLRHGVLIFYPMTLLLCFIKMLWFQKIVLQTSWSRNVIIFVLSVIIFLFGLVVAWFALRPLFTSPPDAELHWAKELSVRFEDGQLSVSDRNLTLPATRSEIFSRLGPPGETNWGYNTLYTWNDLGIVCYERPFSGLVTELLIGIDKAPYHFWPENLFSGRLEINNISVQRGMSIVSFNALNRGPVFTNYDSDPTLWWLTSSNLNVFIDLGKSNIESVYFSSEH